MFDIEPYKNLVPCLFEKKIKDSVSFVEKDYRELNKFNPEVFNENFLHDIKDVKSWFDFHTKILSKYVVPSIVSNTSDGITIENSQVVRKGEAYLFLSNHRDIILDCFFVGYSLIKDGKGFVQPVIGSNLTDITQAEPYFALCGSVVINRGLPVRELYAQSVLLSDYICKTIQEKYSSIWIAGGAGRSKDGIDSVKSSLLKMIMLSFGRKKSVNDFLSEIKIVPVSISYEYNPSDILITYAHTNEDGLYKKLKKEDYISMLKSLKKYKGKINLSFGDVVKPEFDDIETLTSKLEDELVKNYKLYPINYYAYDVVNNTNKFAKKYTADKMKKYFDKAKFLSQKVKDNLFMYYANPVISKISRGIVLE